MATIVGARPQFIKNAPISRALRDAGHEAFLIHTGQHYDYNMSRIFFEELGIPEPEVNLGVGSGTHGWQTGQMLIRLEEVLLTVAPDWVLVFGDTNSTLAGALAACKLCIPLAHIEAGLRSFRREMPEEYNRVITDHCSDLLFCPSQTAVENLRCEGVTRGVHLVGDVMYEAVMHHVGLAEQKSKVLETLGVRPGTYVLATVHRAENTDELENLRGILAGFDALAETVIFPAHPRVRKALMESGLTANSNVRMIEPVGYLDMLMLEKNARMILTDSGGVQKEAYWFGVPCLTLREQTEWVETVEAGWNRLVGTAPGRIRAAAGDPPSGSRPTLYGDGGAAQRIVDILSDDSARP